MCVVTLFLLQRNFYVTTFFKKMDLHDVDYKTKFNTLSTL